MIKHDNTSKIKNDDFQSSDNITCLQCPDEIFRENNHDLVFFWAFTMTPPPSERECVVFYQDLPRDTYTAKLLLLAISEADISQKVPFLDVNSANVRAFYIKIIISMNYDFIVHYLYVNILFVYLIVNLIIAVVGKLKFSLLWSRV